MPQSQINQQPTALALTSVSGSPFSLFINFTFSGGASVAWSNVTNANVIITDQYGNNVPGAAPLVTSPVDYTLDISFTAAQTSAISNAQSPRWALQATVVGTTAQTFLSGPILFVPPTWPGQSNNTTATLNVNTGVNIIELDVSVTGAGAIAAVTSQDNSIVISNEFGPLTDLSAKAAITAASIGAVGVAESYAFGLTQSASVGSNAYAFGITKAASVGAIAVSETYADTSARAASVSAVAVSEAYALQVAQSASVNAAVVSDPRGYASVASTAAIAASEAFFTNALYPLSAYGAPSGDITGATDTPLIQNWLNAITANQGIGYATPGQWYINSLLINGAAASITNVKLHGGGAVFNVVGAPTGGLAYRGLELRGTLTDIDIDGLRFICDGNAANQQAGIWSSSSTNNINHLRIANCYVYSPTVGIYVDILSSSGAINDVLIENNKIYYAAGSVSGSGYGIAGSSGVTNEVIRDNYIEGAGRHSIYVSAPPGGHVAGVPDPNGIVVSGNRVLNHRVGWAQGPSPLPAINISRTQNVDCHDNIVMTPYDVGIQVQQDPLTADGSFDAWSVSIHDNQVIEPQVPIGASSLAAGILIGTSITTAGATAFLMNVDCHDNFILVNGQNVNGIRLQNGLHIRVINNDVQILNPVAADSCIVVDAQGFPNSSNDYELRGNQMVVTAGSVGASGISLTSAAATSGLTARFDSNKFSGPVASRLWATASVTAAQNMIFTNHANYTGLTFSPVQGAPQPITSDKLSPNPRPAVNNLLAWTYDSAMTISAELSGRSAGVVTLARVIVQTTSVITNVLYYVSTAASVLTTNENFIGVYDSGGNILGTTNDMSAIWTSTGAKISALTSPTSTVVAGSAVYVAELFNGTTPPLLRSIGNATEINAGITTSGLQRYGTILTGQTTLPLNITPSGIATLSSSPWFGLN